MSKVPQDQEAMEDMAWIQGGTFRMGSPDEEPGHNSGGYDETAHIVTLTRPFYLSKHETAAQVVQAVRSAARGEALIAPYMLARLLRGLQKKDVPGPATPLTPRELEVLRELALGHDNELVAKTLKMSPNTVRTHVQNILSKLNVHSKLEAVSRGIREGWIRIPQEPAA